MTIFLAQNHAEHKRYLEYEPAMPINGVASFMTMR